MAEEAKTKPVEAKPKTTAAVKEYEFERPMTSKEKEEYFREKAAQARRAAAAAVSTVPHAECSVASSGYFHAHCVVFFPLEYFPFVPPYSTYVIVNL